MQIKTKLNEKYIKNVFLIPKFLLITCIAFNITIFLWVKISLSPFISKKKFELDVNEIIKIPAGEFTMGSDETAGIIGIDYGVDEVPKHKRFLNAYYLDKYEVTNYQYQRFIKETGYDPPLKLKMDDSSTYLYNWEGENYPEKLKFHPVVLVQWYDADNFCRWSEKKLPTEAQWEKGARGTDGRDWPWGNTFKKMNANYKDLELKFSTPVGSFPNGASPYGIMDMAGNVFEWTADWYDRYEGNTLKRKDFGKKYKVTKGGAFSYWAEPEGRLATRFIAQPPTLKHRSYGFRCAKDI